LEKRALVKGVHLSLRFFRMRRKGLVTLTCAQANLGVPLVKSNGGALTLVAENILLIRERTIQEDDTSWASRRSGPGGVKQSLDVFHKMLFFIEINRGGGGAAGQRASEGDMRRGRTRSNRKKKGWGKVCYPCGKNNIHYT